MNTEEFDYLNDNFDSTVEELDGMSEKDLIKIEINQGLEEALSEMESLRNLLSADESATLLNLCKNTVIDTITGQFGLAGMFIECKDGGNVTTMHNFEKGVTSSYGDKQKYDNFVKNNDENRDWQGIRKSVGYDKPLPAKRKEAFKNQEKIVDAYTGKELKKDGRAHLDHIVPAREIEQNAKNHLFKTPEERAKMATSDKNLAWTDGSINQSKNDMDMKEWLKKNDKKTGKTNAEKFEIKEELALEADRKARKYIKKEITVATVKKYSSELALTGGKDAAKMAAYSAMGVILRDFTQGLFIEIHTTFKERGNESLSDIFNRFKARMSKIVEELKLKWGDILKNSFEGGITAFLSNLLVFAINLFATTLKKLVTMIRAGFVSLVQAIKIMANPPVGMDREEANYQALKILTAGLIGAASLGLSAGIEKFLQAIPGLQPLMMFPIPSFGGEPRTVSDIIAVTLSALAGGILSTVALYFMDKCRQDEKNSRIHIQLVNQSGIVAQYNIAKTWYVIDDAYNFLGKNVVEAVNTSIQMKSEIDEMNKKTEERLGGLEGSLKKLQEMHKRHKNITDKE
jgi:hypothetical protein